MNLTVSFISLCSTLTLVAFLAMCRRDLSTVAAIQSRTFDED